MLSKTVRLTNFVIDTIVYLVFMYFLLLLFRNIIDKENVKWISMVCYLLYYFIFEYFMGQTIGKMITRSKVVSNTGKQNNYFIRILVRTLMRFIPLDILSYLFTTNGFHDRISKTITVKT